MRFANRHETQHKSFTVPQAMNGSLNLATL